MNTSVRQEIAARRTKARQNMAGSAVSAAVVALMLAVPHITGPVLVTVLAMNALGIAANGYLWQRARKAQQIYDSNPIVAYLAEVRHAFSDGDGARD